MFKIKINCFFFVVVIMVLGLNSGLHAYKAGTLPLESLNLVLFSNKLPLGVNATGLGPHLENQDSNTLWGSW
jgi:hypothetical protein